MKKMKPKKNLSNEQKLSLLWKRVPREERTNTHNAKTKIALIIKYNKISHDQSDDILRRIHFNTKTLDTLLPMSMSHLAIFVRILTCVNGYLTTKEITSQFKHLTQITCRRVLKNLEDSGYIMQLGWGKEKYIFISKKPRF